MFIGSPATRRRDRKQRLATMGCSTSLQIAETTSRSAQSRQEVENFLRAIDACPTLLEAKVEKKRKDSFGEDRPLEEEDSGLPHVPQDEESFIPI
eukprot:Skav205406  [mRNA]  locus=scaffold1642:506089:508190:+ [translate_table: standard]